MTSASGLAAQFTELALAVLLARPKGLFTR